MNIWITRHGQTDLNLARLMQGRTDEPLNETGVKQAREMRGLIGDMRFDAVYASPLRRAVSTAAIVGNVDKKEILVDPRIIETDFGKYEKRNYSLLGPFMSLYWAFPEIFPAPRTVETIDSMKKRTTSFLQELEKKDYENVLVVCHGGIMRVLSGYLMDRPNGICWRPRPHNCEIRVFEAENGKHHMLRKILKEK